MKTITRSIIYGFTLCIIAANAYSHGGDSSLIHACIDAQSVLKFSGPDLECPPGETPVHWAIQGPPGPLDPELLGRISTLELQVATLQQQIATLISPVLPNVAVSDVTSSEGTTGNAYFTFTVSLSSPSANTVVVNWLTADGTADATDYSAGSGQLIYLPGETSKVVSVSTKADTSVEPDETFRLEIASAVNAAAQGTFGTGTILNDDLPSVSLSGQTTGTEGDVYTYTASLSGPAPFVVSVDYSTVDGTATAGNDFASTIGTLVFNPGDTTAQFTVQSNTDALPEGQENFSVQLSNPVKAVLTGNIQVASSITDILNSGVNLSIGDTSVIEGNSGGSPFTSMVMTISLNHPIVSGTVTVHYGPTAGGTATPLTFLNANSGGDYRVIQYSSCNADSNPSICPTLTFNPGETQKTITIQINGDRIVEPNENFFVKIFGATGADITDSLGEGVISNDD